MWAEGIYQFSTDEEVKSVAQLMPWYHSYYYYMFFILPWYNHSYTIVMVLQGALKMPWYNNGNTTIFDI